MLKIDTHPSAQASTVERELIDSLRTHRLHPKLLYVTPAQAESWRRVSLQHSPIHGNPEFARIYRDSFARVAEQLPAGKVMLVGLGCGTGGKEAELYSRLESNQRAVRFSAIDVSRDLVAESALRLVEAGAEHAGSLVCDLAEADYLAGWIAQASGDLPRLFTFFGLVPNLAPAAVVRLFRAILRPRDVVLVSAHLAPVGEGVELAAAMRRVSPQYDNPETLAWLGAALDQANLRDLLDAPEMEIGEIEGIPAFVAAARWKSSEPFERWGQRFNPKIDEPLRLFHSLRYTPAVFEEMLGGAGFQMKQLAVTACREEGIWAVRR